MSKRESKEARDLREWHERCRRLLVERAPWLREYEFEMLDSQERYSKPPTDNRKDYASHIARETELLSGMEGLTVHRLIEGVAAKKALLSTIEEEEHVTELEQSRPAQLPRREVQWLFDIFRREAS